LNVSPQQLKNLPHYNWRQRAKSCWGEVLKVQAKENWWKKSWCGFLFDCLVLLFGGSCLHYKRSRSTQYCLVKPHLRKEYRRQETLLQVL